MFDDLLRFSVNAISYAFWLSVFISLFFSDIYFGVDSKASYLEVDECDKVPSTELSCFF